MLEDRSCSEDVFDAMERDIRTVEENMMSFLVPRSSFLVGEKEVGASFQIDHTYSFWSQKKCLYEVFLVLFGVDEDLIGDMTTDEINEVPEPRSWVPAGNASPIIDISIVERNECIEEESLPRPPAQEPSKWDEVVSGEGDEKSGER